MSIKIVANLYPRGHKMDERWLATIDIVTSDDRTTHFFCVRFGDREIRGSIPKKRSAHQNLLHVLREILSTPEIAELGPNHIKRGGH